MIRCQIRIYRQHLFGDRTRGVSAGKQPCFYAFPVVRYSRRDCNWVSHYLQRYGAEEERWNIYFVHLKKKFAQCLVTRDKRRMAKIS